MNVRTSKMLIEYLKGLEDRPGYEILAKIHLAKGEKIPAIKVVREATGWGLKEAKEFVEKLEGAQA